MPKQEDLQDIVVQPRRDILRMVHKVNSGHPGGSLGCTEFFVALYHEIMELKEGFDMDGIGEDLFFLSNGHISPVFYSVLARKGYFPIKELSTFRLINSRLQGHPTTHEGLPGVRVASGSLGQGMSVAIGAALAKKLNGDTHLIYSLHGDGVLSSEPPESAGSDQYKYDPEDPVPTIGTMGPYDQRPVEERSDVLVYTSALLENDLEVTGPVRAVIYASSTAVNTDFTAKLVDVYPDGRAIRICEGIIRASHRDPEASPSNIEPGKIYEYTLDLWATSNVFLKGHRLRVEISSSNFPRFDRNLNTGLDFARDTTWTTAGQTLFFGPEYSSCIILPLIFSE